MLCTLSTSKLKRGIQNDRMENIYWIYEYMNVKRLWTCVSTQWCVVKINQG